MRQVCLLQDDFVAELFQVADGLAALVVVAAGAERFDAGIGAGGVSGQDTVDGEQCLVGDGDDRLGHRGGA